MPARMKAAMVPSAKDMPPIAPEVVFVAGLVGAGGGLEEERDSISLCVVKN